MAVIDGLNATLSTQPAERRRPSPRRSTTALGAPEYGACARDPAASSSAATSGGNGRARSALLVGASARRRPRCRPGRVAIVLRARPAGRTTGTGRRAISSLPSRSTIASASASAASASVWRQCAHGCASRTASVASRRPRRRARRATNPSAWIVAPRSAPGNSRFAPSTRSPSASTPTAATRYPEIGGRAIALATGRASSASSVVEPRPCRATSSAAASAPIVLPPSGSSLAAATICSTSATTAGAGASASSASAAIRRATAASPREAASITPVRPPPRGTGS